MPMLMLFSKFCPPPNSPSPYPCLRQKLHLQTPAFSSSTQLSPTSVPCPACGYREAAYYQVKIRSADEPMTTIYKCKNKMCGNNWRED